jgi:hypothetical protein
MATESQVSMYRQQLATVLVLTERKAGVVWARVRHEPLLPETSEQLRILLLEPRSEALVEELEDVAGCTRSNVVGDIDGDRVVKDTAHQDVNAVLERHDECRRALQDGGWHVVVGEVSSDLPLVYCRLTATHP